MKEIKLFTEGVKCEQCGIEKEVAFNPYFEMTLCEVCWHVLSEQEKEKKKNDSN